MHSEIKEQHELNGIIRPGTSKSMRIKAFRDCLYALVSIFLTSACSSSYFDQSLNESQSLRNCYASIRDNRIDSISDCGNYVIFHAPLYQHIDQSNPEIASCEFSLNSLAIAKSFYSSDVGLRQRLKDQASDDCDNIIESLFKNHKHNTPRS